MLNLPFTPAIVLTETHDSVDGDVKWGVSLCGSNPEAGRHIDCPTKAIAEWLAELLKSRLAQERKETPYLSYLRAMSLRGAKCADAHHVAMISQTPEEAAAVAIAMSQTGDEPKDRERILAEIARLMAVAS